MTDKSLILIDEQDQEPILREISRNFRVEGINLTYEQVNPSNSQFQSIDENGKPFIDMNKIRDRLLQIGFFKYSDAIACDFNLVEGLNGFEVITEIRNLGYKLKKEVILYSAGIDKVINTILDLDSVEERSHKLQQLFKANINYVQRDDYKVEVIKLIKKDPAFDFELEIVKWMTKFAECKFLGVYPNFIDKTMIEVAKEIENKTDNGINYKKELVEQLFSLIIDLNELPRH